MTHVGFGALVTVTLTLGIPTSAARPGPGDLPSGALDHIAAASAQPSPATTRVRVHVRTTPDSAYGMVARLLTARGYEVREGVANVLTTSDRYVAGVGMVRLHARVLPDSLGARVDFSGEWRRLRRLFIFSAMTKDSVVIASGEGGARGAQAWQELTAIAEELDGEVTYGSAIVR